MFEFQNQIVIEKPVDEVFRFTADMTNIPLWNYFVREVEATSPNRNQAGATFHQVRKNDEQNLRLVDIQRNSSFTVETIPPSSPELKRKMAFEAEGDGTKIIDSWQLDMGVPKLLEPLAANRAKSGVKQNLSKLKELLETGSVVLQDGRHVFLSSR
jgi:uncharacterized membrane protein